MAYDEGLAQRIRDAMPQGVRCEEKRMFGGLCFLARGHMLVGLAKHDLMVRVGPEAYERALALPHARPMDFTGRPMKGYVFVRPQGVDRAEDLEAWIGRALEFNRSLPAKKKP